jgi:hypothetical protein
VVLTIVHCYHGNNLFLGNKDCNDVCTCIEV